MVNYMLVFPHLIDAQGNSMRRHPTVLSRLTGFLPAALLVTLFVAIATLPVRADVQAGLNAAKRGNYKMAHTEFLREAKRGNPHAQVLLAELYHKGRGVAQDYGTAAEWYRKAADQNHVVAQYMIGDYHRRGLGVDRSYEQAVEWYHRAAAQNLPLAQYALGIHYRDGLGVEKDQAAATEWFERAARNGLLEAQINLAIRYWRGDVVEQNRILAYAWMRKAAGQGNIGAVQRLKDFENDMSEDEVTEGKRLSLGLTSP